MITKYISSKLIEFRSDIKTIGEAIEACGQLLIDQGLITSDYTQSMVDTYKTFGPYMVLIDNVALFHGKPGIGVNRTGMCLIVLEHSIDVEKTEKKLRLCFAFSSINHEDHIDMIQSFASFIMGSENLTVLMNSKSKSEVLELFKQIGDK